MDPMILKMKNIIQDYAWGSRHFLQDLTGTAADGPLAELWMGVHPRGASQVETAPGQWESLPEVIGERPAELLGQDLSGRFGSLPFLFKLLAAGEPLSIQAHPSKEQAEEGFRREDEAGIPRDAFNRNYKDDNHKPEIICAMTPYWAMKGFRSPGEIRDNFRPWLPAGQAEKLLEGGDGDDGMLRSFFLGLMELTEEERQTVLSAALTWCEGRDSDACRWVLKLQEKYPGDVGILAPLYLNTLQLQPGEALYLPAGELHAYLEGFGVELMANSDNVLRGGLTPKFMDVPELMKTLTFSPDSPEILTPRPLADGTAIYDTVSGEFQLLTADLRSRTEPVVLAAGYTAAILVVTEDTLTVTEGDRSIVLAEGESCFLSRCGESRTIEGPGFGFLARAVPE